MLIWVPEGDLEYAVRESNRRPLASIRKRKSDRSDLRWTLPRLKNKVFYASREDTLVRWVERFASSQGHLLHEALPPIAEPYAIPEESQEYFFDSIWKGSRPASKRPRK